MKIAPAVFVLLIVFPAVASAHIHIDSPAGGEVVQAGSEFTITWHIVIAHALENWDLYYSLTGPDGPWIPIAIDLAPGDETAGSVHTFDWTVPDDITDDARVAVHMDNEGTEEDMFWIIPYDFFIVDGPVTEPLFVRGDCNGDEAVNLADAIFSLQYLFNGGAAPPCEVACDIDDDENLAITDPVLELSYLYSTGAMPRPPFPYCGWDPTPSALDCAAATAGCP